MTQAAGPIEETTLSAERFQNKTVIVTGAGSGIGRATAVRLLSEGAKVVATDVVADRLEALTAEVGGDRLSTVLGDIAAQSTIDALLAAAGPTIDGLANVAGIMDAFLPPSEVDDATWDRVLAVNLTGPMRLARAVLPTMIAAGKGSIVNVSSEAGLKAGAAGAAYTTSKHAVIGYTKSISVFHAPQGVRANAVAPGAVMTNIEAPFKSQYAAERLGPIMGAVIPAPATAEQLAAAICWLLSDDSANVTGVVLPSDGGWSAI